MTQQEIVADTIGPGQRRDVRRLGNETLRYVVLHASPITTTRVIAGRTSATVLVVSEDGDSTVMVTNDDATVKDIEMLRDPANPGRVVVVFR